MPFGCGQQSDHSYPLGPALHFAFTCDYVNKTCPHHAEFPYLQDRETLPPKGTLPHMQNEWHKTKVKGTSTTLG